MTKKQLARYIAKTSEGKYSIKEANDIVETFVKSIRYNLVIHDTINIHNFGKFKRVVAKEKIGNNIRRGRSVVIPAQHKVKFYPCASLKKVIKKVKIQNESNS